MTAKRRTQDEKLTIVAIRLFEAIKTLPWPSSTNPAGGFGRGEYNWLPPSEGGSPSSRTSTGGGVSGGVTDVLPFVEVDAKKIVSRVIEWAKELCISKSVFLMTMQNAPSVLHINREKKFRKSFRAMISTCWVKNLQARPSAERLLRHSVFKKARSQDYIVRTILEGLSTLGDHLKELKLKEDDMIEQQKIPDGKKEEMSQVVPAWLGCFPIKGDLIEAKVVYDQLSTMVKRCGRDMGRSIAGPSHSTVEMNRP
ncbi:hypothetical protein QJS10_CPA08g01149 [Acorus calamus]|uniref:Uncharacterized protein n=1 Tax=Acorus calamus TaxID=4465 RepID=A0AAV9EA01_ACOCL|nr:hypothetical protein QJS10_CPA08g01149 [Acorus calamus]